MRGGVFALFMAAPVMAEEPAPLPDFETCKNAEIARFERNLGRAQDGAFRDMVDILDVGGMDVCGVIGIMRCDRGGDPLPCQHDLAKRQEALRQEVLAGLPAPEAVPQTGWAMGLYGRVWHLAQGRSAGDDCAGNTDVMAAWCEAREATRRLTTAVLAYQLAREAGAVERAVDQGWAKVPPPVRPQARSVRK